ncbi:fructose PTS transporter subunit IIA [Carnobacterium sp.]|uniref:PTS sugar transporter subunit IIA n=1 Tax=Carnobacterium sp. TaxID=48221 RepID=UPI0028ACADD4|nr:fructose PTS transporter subunit IIA [Carnobacterium sp.]
MKLSDFITSRNIMINLQANSKREVIEKMAECMFKNGYLFNKDEFVDEVLERESYTTTGIGNNLAIPHGKGSAVKEAAVIFAKTQIPIGWDSLDDKPVDTIFLMAVPVTDDGSGHLRLLADLSGKLMDDLFVEAIRNENSVDRLADLLTK